MDMKDAELQDVSLDRLSALPDRPADGHKGTFGTVIVVGGSRTMIGAPALCARAAVRGGAGLVKIATLASVLPHVLTLEPAATGIALNLEHDPASAAAMLDDADADGRAVLAVGPGWGQSAEAGQMLADLLAGRRVRRRGMVLDADGLNLLAGMLRNDAGIAAGHDGDARGARVLTPHPGEFRRLADAVGLDIDPVDEASRRAAAAGLCARLGVDVVLLKGRHTVVSDGRRTYINTTGNPALATAGSGDVLTGLIAALLAQGMGAFDAAAWGAHLHGHVADRWAQRHGPSGLHAMELADALPDALQLHRRT
jgi:ADP-dependent NAD(P)H-hydrate dehydratase